jgi:hypothetical protein
MSSMTSALWYSMDANNRTSACMPQYVADGFGPASRNCQDDFDFTLLFEQSIMSIGPSALFLLVFSFRIAQLLKKKTVKVKKHILYALKLV